ncbi:MAG: acetylesterase [Solobacterium sp.]|nr:acetylesterase [Solobacterium sp.]
MALIQVNYLSKALFRTVPVQVILPVDRISFETMDYEPVKEKFKTLYLLHGLLGNYTDWVSGTRIQRWAEEKNLAVVMPSGDNSFYVNSQVVNNDYGEFIGHELVEVTRRMFPLSDKREDTFIAGLSMGGFGALRNGIKYADTFGYVAGLSSAVHLFEDNADNVAGEGQVFGDIAAARKTDLNPKVALENVLQSGKTLPKFYMACGLSDGLLASNRDLHEFLVEHGADVTYIEEPGAHEWDFWDRQIKCVLDWLPLAADNAGMNSGNVTK